MPITESRLSLNPNGRAVSEKRGFEVSPVPPADVRSTVAREFTLMEQRHDRIRFEELAVRLRDPNGR